MNEMPLNEIKHKGVFTDSLSSVKTVEFVVLMGCPHRDVYRQLDIMSLKSESLV